MRLLLDTCVVIDLLTDYDSLNPNIWTLINDSDNMVYASFETARELIVHFNNKKLLSKHWKTPKEMLDFVEGELGIEFLPLRRDTAFTYAGLQLNDAMDHHDPSDHVIIAHAITEHLTLLSSDTKFPFYRSQGLDLIEY